MNAAFSRDGRRRLRSYLARLVPGRGRVAREQTARAQAEAAVRRAALLAETSRLLASTLDTTRLFRESERRRRAAQTLAEVGRFLNQALDPDVVAQRITDSVRALLGLAPRARLRHLHAGRGRLRALAPRARAGSRRRRPAAGRRAHRLRVRRGPARALAVGFQVHVPKPVEPAELVEVVARLAGR
jgi:hypothetical protein